MSGYVYVVLFFWVMIAVAVGIHATNKDRSGFLWGFVTVLTGLVGVFVYVLVLLSANDSDDDESRVRVCPACSARHTGSPEYCSDCGESLEEGDDRSVARVFRSGSDGYCSDCQSKVELDADACPNCGSAF